MLSARLVEWAKATLGEKKRAANDDLARLSQLTIVIPSFGRQNFLLRQVAYWGHSRATVIIVDGSPASIASELEGLLHDLPNITYLNFVDTYANRLREACRNITTPYAMCLADDDLFLMKGLCLAIDHLDRNSDVVACIGQAMAVDFDHQKQCAYFFRYGDSLRKYRVMHADSAERIRLGMNAYRSATFYAVFRAPIFTKIWDALQMTSCPEVIEYEQAIRTYMLGSLSSIDDLYWIRSFECDAVNSPIDGSRKLDFATWWSSREYKDDCAEFVERQARNLSRHSSLGAQEARNVILEAMAFILSGKSTGLMNEDLFSFLVNRASKFIRSHPRLAINKLRSTKLGMIIRNKIRNTVSATVRNSAVEPIVAAESGITGHMARELDDIRALMSSFHTAQRSSD